MRKNLFWLSNEQWPPIKPHLRTDVCGRREEGRLSVISGIVHALKRAAAVEAMARSNASRDHL
jgi:transposase